MSLMDNIKVALENEKVHIFNDFDEDELEEETYALEGTLQEDEEDLDLSDDELDELIKEIEEDIRVLEPDSEEDPDLLEDEDVEAYESFVNFLLESDNGEDDESDDEEEDDEDEKDEDSSFKHLIDDLAEEGHLAMNGITDEDEDDEYDIEAGLDAVEDFMEDEYEDMIKAGVDPEDYED